MNIQINDSVYHYALATLVRQHPATVIDLVEEKNLARIIWNEMSFWVSIDDLSSVQK